MSNDGTEKVDTTAVAKSGASIFAGNLPIIGSIWRGINTIENVATDVKNGQYGKGVADLAAGGVENTVATLTLSGTAGAAVRTAFSKGVGIVAGEQNRPTEARMLTDAKRIVKEAKKVVPKP